MTTKTKTPETARNGSATILPADVTRLFENGYREVEILPDGTLREAPRNGHESDELVTRTLKTTRTWY
jgi:hypothetical protein